MPLNQLTRAEAAHASSQQLVEELEATTAREAESSARRLADVTTHLTDRMAELAQARTDNERRITQVRELNVVLGDTKLALADALADAKELRAELERQALVLKERTDEVAWQKVELGAIGRARDAAVAAQQRSIEQAQQHVAALDVARRSVETSNEKLIAAYEAAAAKEAELRQRIDALSAPRGGSAADDADQLLLNLHGLGLLSLSTDASSSAVKLDVDGAARAQVLRERLALAIAAQPARS